MQKDFFLQIVIDQKAEAKPDLKSADLVFREQTNDLCLILDKPPVKVIMGIRRGGKSTLMLQALSGKQFIYFNFDHELLSQISVKDLSDLFETLYQKIPAAKYFLFDEIQNILGWEFFINKLHRKKLNVLITGSNSHLLSRELATHLTGRHISIELFPFSFNEYLKGQKVELQDLELLPTSQKLFIQNKFTEYLNKGGFPEILLEESGSKFSKMYIRELYDKIITRDLVQRRKIKNIKALKEIAILLISNYSAQFTYSSIRKSSSINSINTIKNYIDYLQEAYLGFVVEPFSYKIKARISLPKKFYLIDISFIDAIFGSSSPDLGKRLENIVYLQLRRFYTEIYYVKQTHYEVDFLIREGRTIRELIQVAWSLEDPKTREQELKALIRGAEDFKCSQLTLITMNHEESLQFAGYQIRIIPAWKWMLGSITPISGC